ncbi:MAG TPA: hypothetical protein PLR83_03230 [Pyrinomonadaceae bacterium]|nr:hypothetical protein [Pyrinomonadaceae bacterium]
MRYEYRLKAILPALFAMLSLLALTAPTCLCAHHEEKGAAVSCHGESHETASTPEGIAVEGDCLCIFAERPSAADKSTPEKVTKEAAVLAWTIASINGPALDRQISLRHGRSLNLKLDLPDLARFHSRGPPA